MSTKKKRQNSIKVVLDCLVERGMVEPGQWNELFEALAQLDHARKVRSWKEQDRAISKIAKSFLR